MKKEKLFVIPATICGNSPFIKIDFENKCLTFLVDSGACGCMIDRKYIQLSDEELGSKETLTGFDGANATGYAVMVFFCIDEEQFCCPFTTLDLGSTFKHLEKTVGEVAGLIGGEFLYNYEAVIDYGTSEIRINRSKIKHIMEEMRKRMVVE